jgi:hypothetical protein
MLRTLGEQPTLWESILLAGMLTMSPGLEPYRAFSMPAWAARPSRSRPICV